MSDALKISKKCPKCNSVLVVLKNNKIEELFLACPNFPECKHTEPIPIDIQLRKLGAPTLPGFE